MDESIKGTTENRKVDNKENIKTEKHLKKAQGRGKKEELEAKVEELDNQLRRTVADFRNLQKRFEEERKEIIRFANKELLERLIPVFDSLFLAARYTQDQGIQLTIKSMLITFKEIGVEKIATEGKEFDPSLMEAVETGDGAENIVIEELRPGFTLYGRLLRPAQVKVGHKKHESFTN